MFRSIRFRLAFSYTVLVALTFLLISWAIYQYIGSSLAATLDQSIYREIDWTLARYERRKTRPEPDDLIREDLFEHASYFPWKEYVEVWSDSATVFYTSPNLGDDTLFRYAAMPAAGGDTLQTVPQFRGYDIRLLVRRREGATFLVAMPTESVTEPLRELLRAFEWLGPVVIIVAIGMGSYLAKRSFSKINEVVETANMITADRLYDRIPAHDTKDEIGRIVTTFNEMISRLDASFRQMKQFSADASHELRTPLSVLRAQLETALNSSAGADELKGIAANCLDEAMRMSTIIDNLLLLARADAGQELVRHESVDLQKLVRETYDECILLASAKSITVALRENQPVTILGDEPRLRQMLLNLIDNAIKYNRMHGTIHLDLRRDTTFADICIADTGIGIPDNQVPRIFDRFYRVDKARSRALGSSGLGLSIAQWVVHAHGGTIEVSSTVNQGSEFRVRLPIAPS